MNDGSYIQSTTFQTNQTYGNNHCINQDGYLAMTPAATLPATLGLNRICQRLGIDVIFISKSNFYLRNKIILNHNDKQFLLLQMPQEMQKYLTMRIRRLIHALFRS